MNTAKITVEAAGLTENPALQSIKRWLWKEEGKIPDADVFSRLYEGTHLIVFRYIYGLMGGPLQEVEDVTAETYARAWKAHHRFTGEEQAALGWLLQIARNLVIDLSRRHKTRITDENFSIDLLVDPAQVPEADVITREQIAILWNMLGMLNTDVREMLVLRYILGWQVRQIVGYLGMNENGEGASPFITQDNGQLLWNPDPTQKQLFWQENGLWLDMTLFEEKGIIHDKEDLISYAESLR